MKMTQEKFCFKNSLAASLIITILNFIINSQLVHGQQANGSNPATYLCSQENGKPATVVRTSTWGNIPIIRWTANVNSTNQTPQQRCAEASEKIQRAYNNGTLRYIRTGIIKDRSVICVAAYKGGYCLSSGVLLFLNSGTKSDKALAHLIDLPTIRAKNPLYQNGGLLIYHEGEAYVNVETLIEAVHGTVL